MAGLAPCVEALLPAGAAAAVIPVQDVPPVLPPEEERLCLGAAPRRRAEFAAGRMAARRAMARLGLPAAPVLRGNGGAPVWPRDCLGSITHDSALALAVVAGPVSCAAIGVDLQWVNDVGPSLWPAFLRNDELRALDASSLHPIRQRAAAFFSLKEAFFKCQYPLTREWVEFEQLEVTFLDGGVPPVLRTVPPACMKHDFQARCGYWGGYVVALVYVPGGAGE